MSTNIEPPKRTHSRARRHRDAEGTHSRANHEPFGTPTCRVLRDLDAAAHHQWPREKNADMTSVTHGGVPRDLKRMYYGTRLVPKYTLKHVDTHYATEATTGEQGNCQEIPYIVQIRRARLVFRGSATSTDVCTLCVHISMVTMTSRQEKLKNILKK